MLRLLLLGMLGATLMLTPVSVAPVSAQTTTNANELAKLVTGLAVLGALGVAIKKARDDDDDRDRKRRGDRDRRDYRDFDRDRHGYRRDRDRDVRWRGGRDVRDRRADPSACLRRIETRRGTAHVYDKRCLDRLGWTVARRN